MSPMKSAVSGPLFADFAKPSSLPLIPPHPSSPTPEERQTAIAPLHVEAALRGKPLRVLVVAAEAVPYVKTGGPADVIGALPQALRKLGHDVRLALPLYKSIDPDRWHLKMACDDLAVPMSQRSEQVRVREATQSDGMPVYFIDAPHYFQREKLYGYNDDGERFILFCRAALEFIRSIGWAPDIIHCHDWQTAIIPNWTRTIYRDDPIFANTATVYTIHNLAVHGIFGYRILEVAGVAQEGFLYPNVPELSNVVDLMGRGILFADVINTVSPSYAREILTPEFGERLDPLLQERKDRLYGILNGMNTQENDPATDESIASPYDAFSLEKRLPNKAALQRLVNLPVEEFTPLIGMISRLSDQKGLDLLEATILPLLDQNIQLVVMGTGDQHYHEMFQRLVMHYPRQVAIRFTFNNELSRQIIAGTDMLLMPSRFEPCGLTQMLAMRYGSIPIVHQTGGLADTVQELDPMLNTGNGFCFQRYDPFQFFAAVVRALEAYRFADSWSDLMQRAMLADNSWDASAEQYVALYRRALELEHISAARSNTAVEFP
ncbi:MAG: glycogen synthase [Nitrososphaerota archaeon]